MAVENRDSTQYLGAIMPERINANPQLTLENFFIFQGSFNLYHNSLGVIYDDYQYAEDFENWKKPLGIFRKRYNRVGDEQFNQFKSLTTDFAGHPALQGVLQSLGLTELNHAQVIDAAIERARTLCNAPAEADFVHLLVSPEAFNLSVKFETADTGEIYTVSANKTNYNQRIQANMDVVMPCLLLGHAMAINDEPSFWTGANWILPA